MATKPEKKLWNVMKKHDELTSNLLAADAVDVKAFTDLEVNAVAVVVVYSQIRSAGSNDSGLKFE